MGTRSFLRREINPIAALYVRLTRLVFRHFVARRQT